MTIYKFPIISMLFLFAMVSTLEAQHDEAALSERLYILIQKEGVEAAIKEYRKIKNEYPDQQTQYENQLNQLGYRLLNNGLKESALLIFTLNAEEHPESINVWDSLGEGYLSIGNNDKASDLYQKVLNMLETDSTMSQQQKIFFRNNANMKLFEAENFDPYSINTLHYVSFYGGVPAGRWDMQNAADFKKNRGINIHYTGYNLYSSPVPTQIGPSLTGTMASDVTTSFIAGDYLRYIDKGFIADITELWEIEKWDRYFPKNFKEMSSYKGRQYFVPMAFQWNPIWYRRDIFEKLDLSPPKTWKELLKLCDTLHEQGYTPFTISVQNWPPPMARWFTILNIRLNGPAFHEEVMKGKISYKTDQIRNVFTYWKQLFDHNAFADSSYLNTYQTGIQNLTSGKAVMYNLGEWIFESLNEEQGKKLDFFVFPTIDPDLESAEIVHTYGAFMRADNGNSDNAKSMLKWLAETVSQRQNVQSNNRTVANMNVDKSLYTGVQKRIISNIHDVGVLVPLFEFSTHPKFARKALAIFKTYWKNPDDIDSALEQLEEARREVFH